jgi:hypothetical protein
MALYLAANGGNISTLGFTLRYYAHFRIAADVKKRLNAWIGKHWELFRQSKPCGEIGLVRHHQSLAWNARQPWFAAMALEHMLTRMKVPWRMIDRIEDETLRELKTLLLADMDCLSDEELTAINRWVENGGRMFFTFRTALFNGYRQRRARHPILDWSRELKTRFNDRIDSSVWFEWSQEDYHDRNAEESFLNQSPTIAGVGKGKLGFWPRLRVPLTGCTLSRRILAEDVCLPEDAPAIEQFVRDLHGSMEIEGEGADSVLVEANHHRNDDIRFLHLVNVKPTDEVVDLNVRLREPWKGKLELLSPDQTPPTMTVQGDRLTIRNLHKYAVVVFHA